MAVVVSHAMRRYPTSPPGSSYSSHCLGGEGSYQDTWTRDEVSESSLSRSMRYAEPWLYGSVRAPGGFLLAPALVLCSCPEYLSGTKRSSKKGPTLCKKCKGTRLPLPSNDTLRGSSKYGTVRCYPTTAAIAASSPPMRSGTVRVNSHSRPSILPSADPYEVMRRSRLSPETGTQFKLNSPPPNKTKNEQPRTLSKKSPGVPKAPSNGRKSILECDINPYDLMSLEPDSKKDSSITLVGGQRVRIRPPTTEQEYEEIKVQPPRQPPSQIPKLKGSSANKPKGPSKFNNEKESDSNRFKSILKKPTTFSDTDSSGGPERSPSPAQKCGSHFYLPMPMNTPRKKVQFLVENELINQKQNDRKDSTDADKVIEQNDDDIQTEDANIYEEVPDCIEEETLERKSLTLRRSVSERLLQEATKVVFNDTMALRTRPRRGDSRIAFSTVTDLQRLDGVVSCPVKVKPPELPPPLPPKMHEKPLENTTQNQTDTKSHKKQLNLDLKPPKEDEKSTKKEKIDIIINEDAKPHKKEKVDPILKPSKDSEKPHTKEKVEIIVRSAKDNEKTHKKEKISFVLKASKDDEKLHKKEKVDIILKPSKDIEDPRQREKVLNDDAKSVKKVKVDVALKSPNDNEKQNESDVKKIDKFESVKIPSKTSDRSSKVEFKNNSETPPAAPPRKRSNSRVTIEPSPPKSVVQTLKIESPTISSPSIMDYQNKTVVQIRSSPTVHKIQIKNEFLESNSNVQTVVVSDNAQRKTSIMINGDDCYSTINVNDDIPMYQSSVVVKDAGTDLEPKLNRSSSVYITGNFINSGPESVIVPSSNKPFQESPMHDVTLNHIKPEKFNELPTKDHKETEKSSNKSEAVKQEETADLPPTTTDITSSEELTKLLKDPVEAVKRNLVPHVCGRSDVPRRPRDKKLNNSASLVEESVDTNINKLIEDSLLKLRNYETCDDDKDLYSENGSSTQYETMDPGSDCYTDNSNRSSVTEEELNARTKFYELLADSAMAEISENEDHHYESIRLNHDPIYEEIDPPPLPSNPPPSSIIDDLQLDKQFTTRSIFEGASKYDILSYLVDAKERGIIPEDSYIFGNSDVIIEEDSKEVNEQFRVSHLSSVSDSSEDSSLVITNGLSDDKSSFQKSAEVERNDSGVGSETSKSSLSRFRAKSEPSMNCEDCETQVETQTENEPLICRKCIKKRSERKEIITEIVETEEKYSRDLQIILEEFYQPMLVAGLLTPEQLSAIFLNVEELLENSQALAERLRDAVEIAIEQGDEDLLTVNIGKLFLEAAPMLHAFETYCIRQGNASLLLASLEKEKELLRIFLRVSQMENTMLRRMNLNSFLMVPVQRVTKYPLLLTRLYKATPGHHETRDHLKDAQHKIELHLNHMNSETKDVPSKLWRRIGNSSGRRSSSEMDLVSIKLRKIAVDVLEWNHEEAKFALEGKLLFTQPTDNNWRKGRTIKLAPINALLVTNGKQMFGNRTEEDGLTFPRNGVREAALLLVRDKNGRYSLLREPLYLDRCIIATDPAWQSYFEVQEVIGKDTFIFKAEDDDLTRMWYRQLQFHAQGLGGWRKRRNALANIMINGMGLRS